MTEHICTPQGLRQMTCTIFHRQLTGFCRVECACKKMKDLHGMQALVATAHVETAGLLKTVFTISKILSRTGRNRIARFQQ